MIRSFRDAETERIFNQEFSRKFQAIAKTALRKLIHLNRAQSLADLAAIPGDRLEALHGDREGQHSIASMTNIASASSGRNPTLTK